MKKTKLLISLIAIVTLLSLNFCTVVKAADTTTEKGQKIDYVFSAAYYCGWEKENQIMELSVGHSIRFYQKGSYGAKTLENYRVSTGDSSILKIEEVDNGQYGKGIKVSALKEGTTTLVLMPSEDEVMTSESAEYTVKVYDPTEYRALREKRDAEYEQKMIADELSSNKELIASNMESDFNYYDKAAFNSAISAAKSIGLETLKINAGNKVIWEFPVEGTTATANFVPYANVSTEKISTIESDKITDALFVDFGHSGDLPAKAKVTLNIGTDKFGTADKTLYLYYYNPTTKSYEFVEEAKYTNGKVSFELSHCSTYALVENKIESELDNEPKTGETSIIAISALAIVSLAMAIIIRK